MPVAFLKIACRVEVVRGLASTCQACSGCVDAYSDRLVLCVLRCKLDLLLHASHEFGRQACWPSLAARASRALSSREGSRGLTLRALGTLPGPIQQIELVHVGSKSRPGMISSVPSPTGEAPAYVKKLADAQRLHTVLFGTALLAGGDRGPPSNASPPILTERSAMTCWRGSNKRSQLCHKWPSNVFSSNMGPENS